MNHSKDDGLEPYSAADLANCLKKVTTVGLESKISIHPDLCFTMYYAGHVFGATMVHLQYGSQSVLFTGDFNVVASGFIGAGIHPTPHSYT